MEVQKSLLALDLGTKTGWALLKNGVVTSGTWTLAKPKEITAQAKADRDRCCEMRVHRLLERVNELLPVDEIWFEDVQFASTTYQAHLWASLRAIVILQSSSRTVKAVPVGTLKKFATGFGNADKQQMKQALFRLLPGSVLDAMDDNEVDARWLLELARHHGTSNEQRH